MTKVLVLSEKLSDVVLKVRHGGYSWRFPAHSLLLTAHSPLLRDMLEDRSDDVYSAPLTIIGLNPHTAISIINYIYLGTIPTKITANLLVAAEKYGLTALRNQLEEAILPNITVPQACELLVDLDNEQPYTCKCPIKIVCMDVLKKHAYRVFSSDLVISLSQNILQELLKSDELNMPDERIAFWGIWRWGLCHSSRNGRTLEEESISCYVADLLKFLRKCSFKNTEGLPKSAIEKFNSCPRRSVFSPPEDSLEQSHCLRTISSWGDIIDFKEDSKPLCLQISFSKDVMLVGFTLEAICSTRIKGNYLRLFEESSGKELSRQEIDCGRISSRKLSRTGDPESWMESDILLLKPLILRRSEIYSVWLDLKGAAWTLPRVHQLKQRTKNIDSTLATVHGQYVFAIRELYLVPDMTISWGNER